MHLTIRLTGYIGPPNPNFNSNLNPSPLVRLPVVRCIVSVTAKRYRGSRTLSILYSGSVRTISILKAERKCGARRNKSEDMHIQTESCLLLHRHHHISVSHYVDY